MVRQLLQLSLIIFSTFFRSSASVEFSINRYSKVSTSNFKRQGSSELAFMIQIKQVKSFICFLSSIRPLNMSILKQVNMSELQPPRILTYSAVNLKEAFSKLIPPGLVPRKNPKSIWIKCPDASIRMFPLCLSFS